MMMNLVMGFHRLVEISKDSVVPGGTDGLSFHHCYVEKLKQ